LRYFSPAFDLTVFFYNILFFRVKFECHDLFQMLFTLLRYKDFMDNKGRDTFTKGKGEPANFMNDDGEDDAD
jgi:hypothetical protein